MTEKDKIKRATCKTDTWGVRPTRPLEKEKSKPLSGAKGAVATLLPSLFYLDII